jgi:branched-chain amino acid transport system substrate-binding protein
MKKILVIMFCFCLVGLLWVAPQYAAGEEPVKIALLSILSGKMASLGDDIKAGVMLAAEEKKTILGRPIELIYEDVETKTDLGVRKAEKVVFKDKVAAILGCGASSVTLAVSGNLPRLKVPQVSTASMSTKLYNVNKYYFRAGQLANNQTVVGFINGMKNDPSLRGRKWYVICVDQAYGHTGAEEFIKIAKKNNIEIVNPKYDAAPIETVDWSAYINKIKLSGATGLYSVLFSSQSPVLHKQAYEFGLTKTVKHLAEGMPIEAGLEACGEPCTGMISAINYSWDIDAPASKQFAEAFWKLNKLIPSQKGCSAYTAAMLLFNAIEKAGSTDANKIIAALETARLDDGPFGPVWMGKDHSARQDIILVEAREAPQNPYGAKMYLKVLMTIPAKEVGPPEPAAFTPGKYAP